MEANAQTHEDFSRNRVQCCQIRKHPRHCQLVPSASRWFHNQVCCASPGCRVFLFSCWRCSSSSSSSLQLKPCVVEKQARVCGEFACLEWEGARRLQRSQSEHANSSWPFTRHADGCISTISQESLHRSSFIWESINLWRSSSADRTQTTWRWCSSPIGGVWKCKKPTQGAPQIRKAVGLAECGRLEWSL